MQVQFDECQVPGIEQECNFAISLQIPISQNFEASTWREQCSPSFVSSTMSVDISQICPSLPQWLKRFSRTTVCEGGARQVVEFA